MRKLGITGLMLAVAIVFFWNFIALPAPRDWSAEQLELIRSLSIEQLPPLPSDTSNRVADIEASAELGQQLYFDTRLSGNRAVACATCHKPELMFTDALELAVGTGIGLRNTPSLVGIAYSPWYYWDGRKDSQWAQALAPLETSHEHASDRLQIVRLLNSDTGYQRRYAEVFGDLPAIPVSPISASPLGSNEQQEAWNSLEQTQQQAISWAFANVGKALAAYQRKLMPGSTRFDAYTEALTQSDEVVANAMLTPSEIAGLRLFIGEAQCISCHNGPLLTNHEFHNTGVLSIADQLPSMGRYDGIRIARNDPFNCLGEFSDAIPSACVELRFARDDNSLVGAQKTPTLRNISMTAPYMHGGQLATLADVLEHYNEAPLSMLSHNEAKPLALRPVQLRQLEAFLRTLTAPLATEEKWLLPPAN